MKNFIKSIFPSPAFIAAFFILPTVLAAYFIFTQYSNQFVLEQNITYFDVQNNIFGQFLIDQKWLEWFNRFMDFAFWGLLAAIVLILIWGVSAAKTAFKNHYVQEEFTNFRQDLKSWHSHFFVVAILRLMLVVVILYSILAIFGRHIPRLSASTGQLAQHGINRQTVTSVIGAGAILIIYQFVIVSAVKTFRHLRAE